MIKLYSNNTVYVIGRDKIRKDNDLKKQSRTFCIGFVIDTETDEIVDISCSTTPITNEFISSIFVGKYFDKYYEEVEEEIKRRYLGISQKSIVMAYKDALKKYREVKEKLV